MLLITWLEENLGINVAEAVRVKPSEALSTKTDYN